MPTRILLGFTRWGSTRWPMLSGRLLRAATWLRRPFFLLTMDRDTPYRRPPLDLPVPRVDPPGSPDPHDADRRTGTAFPVSRYAPLAHASLLAGATAAVFLAGGPQQGALGIFLVCAGAAMIFFRPRLRVEWRLWVVAAAVVGCGALALLPERWVPQPAWRHTLDATPPVVMPGTISTAPTLTLFWLGVLAISLLAGLFLLANPIRARWLLAFALLAALAVGAYGALAIYAKETGWAYPFTTSRAEFGFLPNRNHTATFLFVGALLAVGVLGVVLREGRWVYGVLAGAVVTVCVAGLGVFSPSRGGIVFLLLGVLCWLAGLGRRHRDPRLVVSFVAILLAGAAWFLLSGGQVRDRLLGRATPPPTALLTAGNPNPTRGAAGPGLGATDSMHGLTTDFRFKVYRDTFDAVRDFPLTGMGLGAFPLVFPQYRRASLAEMVSIHPESDWLMLAAEAGVPAAGCLLALLALAAVRLGPERDHPYWPLRWGCAVAAGTAALHGLVDVPAHRVQLGCWLLVIAGLALQSARSGPGGQSRAQHALFVGGGVVALTLGALLVRAQWFGGPPLPPFAVETAEQRIYEQTRRGDIPGALALARQTAHDFPMLDSTYFQLGLLQAQSPDGRSTLDACFQAQRLLDPYLPSVPRDQADVWLGDDPGRASVLLLDALARRRRIAAAAGLPPESAVPLYHHLVEQAAQQPFTQMDLWTAVRQDPPFALDWLETAAPGLAAGPISEVSRDDAFLARLQPGERRRFLMAWYLHGDRAALTSFAPGQAGWEEAAWPVEVRMMADARQFEQAVGEVCRHDGISLELPVVATAVPALGAGMDAAALEGSDPKAAFLAYWRMGNTVSAQRVLNEAAAATPVGPEAAEIYRLKAAVAAHDANWPAAWQALVRMGELTRPEHAP